MTCGPRRANDATVSFVLRVLQLAFSAMALVLFGGGIKGQQVTLRAANGDSISITTYLGSPSLSFLLLVTFSASLYTALWITFVYLRRSVTLPVENALLIDALFVVMLGSSGCAFLASDYLQHCDLLTKSIRCGVVTTATAFVLVAFLFFLSSVAWAAYIRVEEIKKKQKLHSKSTDLRPNAHSGIDVIPFEDSDEAMEDTATTADYISTDEQCL